MFPNLKPENGDWTFQKLEKFQAQYSDKQRAISVA